ncbi:hypothetical protein [Citrobacter gillenii]|uniref:hypothetical protein n=1 Tax=Citrobacter gillenii TaxID=67828 RepID=UPI0039860A4B
MKSGSRFGLSGKALVQPAAVAMAASLFSAAVSADALQEQQQRYQQRWQQEHGPLTQAPPAPLAAFLAAQPTTDKPVYDTPNPRRINRFTTRSVREQD